MSRAGLLYAVLACAGWGFAFVGPLILGPWPGLAVAAGRYIAYGLASAVALALLYHRSRPPHRPGLWRQATALTLTGNLLYYALLSVSVQKAGYVMPTLIIGLLPVTVSLAGRWRSRQAPSARYALALLLILGGLWLAHERPPAGADDLVRATSDEVLGLACAFLSLALWTFYGIANSECLRGRPGTSGVEWASLQGVAALPFALILFVGSTGTSTSPIPQDWTAFIVVSVVLGLITSWAANTLWNMASTRLRPSLLGQMIVFETIAGIGYGALHAGRWPAATVLVGTALLIAGVVVAISEPAPAVGAAQADPTTPPA